MSDAIGFATLRALCAAEGIEALAVLSPPPERLDSTGIDQMLRDGIGTMAWLADSREQRLDPTFLQPGARAILITALPYQSQAGCGELQRARYAAGKDYHNLYRAKLARIGDALNAMHGTTWKHRAAVDSAPLNERTLAQLAGLGWIGRNALLISPTAGSFRVLGSLLTDAPLAAHHAGLDSDRCGTCAACEKRCPTGAITGRRVLSERCISYLTIEHQGVIDRELARHFSGWWFGCDLCQEVCPWNRFAPPAGDPRLTGTEDDARLLTMTAATFDLHFSGRAIRRIGYERFRRNLLVAAFSLGRIDDCQGIVAGGLPLVLAQAEELELPNADC